MRICKLPAIGEHFGGRILLVHSVMLYYLGLIFPNSVMSPTFSTVVYESEYGKQKSEIKS